MIISKKLRRKSATLEYMRRELKSVEEESTEALARMQVLNDELENTLNSLSKYNSGNKGNMVQAYKDDVSTLEDKLNLFKFTETQLKEEKIVVLDDLREKTFSLNEIRKDSKFFEKEKSDALDKTQEFNEKSENTIRTNIEVENDLQQLKEAIESITGELANMMEMIEGDRTDRDTDTSDD